jgi:hypothetical protein
MLYMFQVVPPPIIRSANNYIYSIWYWHVYVLALNFRMTLAVSRAVPHFSWRHTGAIDRHMRYVSTCVGARVVGRVGKQWTKAIRCGACYYSIVVNAHRVTSMADTNIDAVRKQMKAEVYTYSCYAYKFYAYRLYFTNVWHLYEWPKPYTWSGTIILNPYPANVDNRVS